MDTEKCKIKFDSPENTYFSGQEIRGQICIILTKKTKIRGIYFKIHGYGKCNWCEFLRRESQTTTTINEKDFQRSMVYSSREEYLSHKSYIIGSKSSRPLELEPGSHTYDFNYTLESNLPSSFKGNYGSIKYKMEFTVEKAWNFDDKYSINIQIIKSRPLLTYNSYTQPILQQLTRNIGIFNGGPISLVAELPKNTIVRGTTLPLRVIVDNKSSTHVEKLKFSIRQIVTYFSQQPLPSVKRDEVIKIFKKETGGIQKKTERSFEYELQLPPCQPSDESCSKIIFISYEVHVEAVLPGIYKNLIINLPMKICSHESDRVHSIPAQNTSIGWTTLYPSPNISMCSITSYEQQSSIGSPSHSYTNAVHDNLILGSLPTLDRTLPPAQNHLNFLPSITSSSAPNSTRYSLPTIGQQTIHESRYFETSLSNRTNTIRRSVGFGSPPPHSSLFQSLPMSSTPTPGPSRLPAYSRELPPPSYDELFGRTLSRSGDRSPSAPPLNVGK